MKSTQLTQRQPDNVRVNGRGQLSQAIASPPQRLSSHRNASRLWPKFDSGNAPCGDQGHRPGLHPALPERLIDVCGQKVKAGRLLFSSGSPYLKLFYSVGTFN